MIPRRVVAAALAALALMSPAPSEGGPANEWNDAAESFVTLEEATPAARVQAVSMVSRAMDQAGQTGGEPAAAAAAYLLLRALYPGRAADLDRRFAKTAAGLRDRASVALALQAGRAAAGAELTATPWPATLTEEEPRPRAVPAVSVPTPRRDKPRPIQTAAPAARPWWRWDSL